MFTDTNIEITTTGRKHLGAALLLEVKPTKFSTSENLSTVRYLELKLLSIIVIKFKSKLNYFMRTVPGIIHHLVPLEEILCNRFIRATTGGQICNDIERTLLSLPTRFGRLATLFFMNKWK